MFAHSLGLSERLGGVSFMVPQADELVGLASLIAEANGLSRVPHVREKIDEMMIHATPEGYCYPDDMFTNVAKYHGAANFSTMVRHRSKLFHAIRDLTADALGGWHQVTNLQSGGGLFAQKLVTRKNYDIERARALALKAAGLSGA